MFVIECLRQRKVVVVLKVPIFAVMQVKFTQQMVPLTSNLAIFVDLLRVLFSLWRILVPFCRFHWRRRIIRYTVYCLYMFHTINKLGMADYEICCKDSKYKTAFKNLALLQAKKCLLARRSIMVSLSMYMYSLNVLYVL